MIFLILFFIYQVFQFSILFKKSSKNFLLIKQKIKADYNLKNVFSLFIKIIKINK